MKDLKIVWLLLLLMLFTKNVQAQLQATKYKHVYTMERKENLEYPFLWTVNDSLLAFTLLGEGPLRIDTIRIMNFNNEVLHELTIPKKLWLKYPLLADKIVDQSVYFLANNIWFEKKQKSLLVLYKYGLSDKTFVPLTVPVSLFPDTKLSLAFERPYIDEFNKVAYLFDFRNRLCLKYDLLTNTARLFSIPSMYSIDQVYAANGVLFFCDYGSTSKLTDKDDGRNKSYILIRSVTEMNNAETVNYPMVSTDDKLVIYRQPDGSGEVCLDGQLYAFNGQGFAAIKKPAPAVQVQSNRLKLLQRKLYLPGKRGLVVVAGSSQLATDTLKLPNELLQLHHVGDKQVALYDPTMKADINFKEIITGNNRGNTNPTVTQPAGTDRFPYSDGMFSKLMTQYVKERDELYVSYNRYINCLSGGKTKSDCDFYFPLGGKGRAEKLLSNCREYYDLLQRYKDDFTRIVGETYENSKKAFDFDMVRIAELVKVFK
jgi:hypothetical protein